MIRRLSYGLAFLFLLLCGCMAAPPPNIQADPETVILVLYGQSTSDPGLEDMLIEKIGEAFPNIGLEWESMDWGDYFSAELQAKIASGEVPDLIIGKAQDVAGYQPSGYLAPFESFYTHYIRKEALESVTIDGKLYGVPYNALYQGVFYNKALFKEYGLAPARTLEEMNTLIHTLEELEIVPFASHFQDNWYTANILMQFAVNQVFQQTPDWGDQFRRGQRSFAESPEYAACLSQVKTVLEHSWADALTVTQSEADKRFANGEAAMYVTGSWLIQPLQSIQPNMEVGVFPYPNQDGTARLLFEPNITFMKNAQSENIELVDQMILSIIQDTELAGTVSAFTQTESMLMGVESDSLFPIKKDIEKYKSAGNVIDVSVGNSQLVWSFQESCARQMYNWLEGKASLEDLLSYADELREESGNGS